MNTIKLNLAKARDAKGYTQQDMAFLLKRSISGYQKLEQGKVKHIDLELLDQLCAILDCGVSDILIRE